MADKKIIGIPTPRVEGEAKVDGEAVYALDVVLPDMLWAKVLRSPIPYGRIRRIDWSRAERLPGVRCVLTGKDVAGLKVGKRIFDTPILADEVVRFVGEKVAAVAADSEAIAEQALDLIDVDYEEREPIFDPLEAMKSSAPLLHPNVMNYRGLLEKLEAPSNVIVTKVWKKGDVDQGFRQADLLVENTFRTQLTHHAYIEPHSCVVKAAEGGGAEIWASSKSPFNLRDLFANLFQVPPDKVVAHPCYIGGDFGGKGDHNDVALCYVLSRRSGRPVKMVLDYTEEFIAGNPRHSAIINVKTGVKKDGHMVAEQIEFIFDSGAYGGYRPQGFLVGSQKAAGTYRIPNVLIEEKYVYTNKVPCGYMRAPGHVQGFFASECQMDLVAKALGMDPVKFRQINFMRDGDELPTGHSISYIRPEETLKKVLEASGYYEPKGKDVGRGLAIAPWVSHGGESSVYVGIDQNGGVTLSAAVMDVGPGAYTLMRQIVAAELQIALESVKVEMVDNTRVAVDTGVRGSSSTRVHGGAAFDAAKKVKSALLQEAARHMGASPEELILAQGGVLHGRAERRMTYSEIARAKGEPIVCEGHYSNMSDGPESSMVAQMAEVEVDRETGEVKIRKFITAHNTGTIINPLMHQGQIDGGVVMGMGYALMEEMTVQDGKVATTNLGDYKVPTIQDIPKLGTALHTATTGSGPYNSMSIGETAIMTVAPAIANAIHDAVGVRISSLPITAEKVFRALRSR